MHVPTYLLTLHNFGPLFNSPDICNIFSWSSRCVTIIEQDLILSSNIVVKILLFILPFTIVYSSILLFHVQLVLYLFPQQSQARFPNEQVETSEKINDCVTFVYVIIDQPLQPNGCNGPFNQKFKLNKQSPWLELCCACDIGQQKFKRNAWKISTVFRKTSI